MARSIDNKFYQSKAWRECRQSFVSFRIKTNGGVCMRCNERPARIVHHLIHLTEENVNDPNIAFGFDNLEFICQRCHNGMHAAAILGTEYDFDCFGNPIPRR